MRRPRRSALLLALLCGVALPELLAAQGARVLVQGIVDGEGWTTDTNSNLLTRNAGKAGVLGRVQMWGAVEAGRGFVFYVQGEAEQGGASGEEEAELDQFGLRYTASPWLVLDAGRFPHLIGTFAARRFSSRNPLVGAPDAYPVQYPHGAQLSGAARFLDYRVGVVDLPAVHEEYTPEPDRAWRPAIGGGITPYVGLRLGGSFTWGPYLNDELTSAQLAQRSWRSYSERIAAADLAFSFGYLELTAEAARSSYDVPNRAEPVAGWAYYVEGKYTLTPRLYVATRLERNDYPFIMAFPTFWVARKTDFHNEEYGVGFRFTARTLVKTSYRRDRWHVDAGNQAFVRPGGHAFAVQLSQTYDVMEWIERARLR
jgi:hypothetical protein